MPDLEKNKKQSIEQGGKKKGKGMRRNVTIILSVLVVVTLIGLAGYFIVSQNSSPSEVPQNFVSYPTVSQSVSSSADGKTHSIDLDLVVEYAGGASESVSHDAVYRKMSETVGKLDYEDLRGFNSVEHIESSVLAGLSGMTGEGVVAKVYVSNIAIDFPGFVNSEQENAQSTDSSMNQKLRGLFKNLN